MRKLLSGSGGFYRNTATLIVGTGIAQAIPVLLQPALRRIYTPEEFGAYAVFFSIFWILTAIASFRYELAIGLPEKDSDGANLVFLSLIINLVFNLILLGMIILFKDWIAGAFRFPQKYSTMLYLLPFCTFFFCSFEAMNYWLIRKKAFRSITVNKVSRRGAEGIVQLAFGFFRNPAGLFWADLAGGISNNISGINQLRRTGFSMIHVSRQGMISVMKRYSGFPKSNLLPYLMRIVALQLPVLMINQMFTKTEVGNFNLTQQAIVAPFGLITVAVSQVLLQMITEKKHKGQKIMPDFIRLSGMLLSIGILALLIIELWGPGLFSFLFGNKCTEAGNYSRILIIGYMFFLVVSPMNSILLGLEKIRSQSFWNIIHFLLLIGLYFIKNVSVSEFLMLYAGLETIAYTSLFIIIARTVNRYDKQLK
jgi:O-antigen/teichoic acid export membrane protein